MWVQILQFDIIVYSTNGNNYLFCLVITGYFIELKEIVWSHALLIYIPVKPTTIFPAHLPWQ